MKEQNEWEALVNKWSTSLKKARASQAIIDDKMSSYLRGTGRIPTLNELAKVEHLWEVHLEARQATNRFIAQKINSKRPQTYTGTDRRKTPREDSGNTPNSL